MTNLRCLAGSLLTAFTFATTGCADSVAKNEAEAVTFLKSTGRDGAIEAQNDEFMRTICDGKTAVSFRTVVKVIEDGDIRYAEEVGTVCDGKKIVGNVTHLQTATKSIKSIKVN